MRSRDSEEKCEYVYDSPCGPLRIVSTRQGVTSLSFDGDATRGRGNAGVTPLMRETIDWLDVYFAGKDPGATPLIAARGTPFREEVWEILKGIPYGSTMTYGEIAEELARRRGIKRMSAQAVGNAAHWNPVAILIPCHRVVGADGSLIGYGGGLERKRFLLGLEHGFYLNELIYAMRGHILDEAVLNGRYKE